MSAHHLSWVLFWSHLDARDQAALKTRVDPHCFDRARHECVHCEGNGVETAGPDLVECPWCEGTGEDPEAAA